MVRTARIEQRRRGFKSKVRKLLAVCMGGVLLLSSRQAVAIPHEGILRRSLSGSSPATNKIVPTFNKQVATCTVPSDSAGRNGATATITALTLSKENLSATLKCSGANYVAVPESMKKVCSATVNDATLAGCKAAADNAGEKQITLQELLGSSGPVEWTKASKEGDVAKDGEEWTLQLQESDLPLTDKAFFVGCDNNAVAGKDVQTPSKECKVDFNVKARPSFVAENNVVTCAYGKESNPKPLKVEMTTEMNTLTIQCGSQGVLNPKSYTATFCDPQDTDMQNCTEKKFEAIFPSFVETWWAARSKDQSATLIIPEAEFPQSEQQFRLSCIYKEAQSTGTNTAEKVGENSDSAKAAPTSNCHVIVTVTARSSTSSSGHLVTTVAGAAALTGLLAGSY
ncbi:SAG-related sequence SRS40E [Toxoplasma gondii VEG]|uniref:SRS40E n=1 Tax=Toxoplasma gondii (strain ATCC 50861 / VEG) TaxID=432359 RepID=B9Q7L3_TOXGV|nr:SAG-related sequence SRS40E [Toxoplasma gondii VEG]CEL76638.1 TPA: SRS40E [Toxoplasma gondii VEG]